MVCHDVTYIGILYHYNNSPTNLYLRPKLIFMEVFFLYRAESNIVLSALKQRSR